MSVEPTHMPYEGAGFLLRYNGAPVLGLRRKKEADKAKDATLELEYMGGKVEEADQNDPFRTAYNELAEELGALVLDPDTWRSRAVPLHIFQPFSQKWIWCFLYDLNVEEWKRLRIAAADLKGATDKWDRAEPYASWTGRAPVPVRQSLDGIYLCDPASMRAYMAGFAAMPASKNRMADAKAYRESAKLSATHLVNGTKVEIPLRAFNTVMWEAHAERICQ
jgi:hypothetical protein